MKIGIIGSGNMGRAIGVRLAQLGHAVLFGARRADQAETAAAAAGNDARSGTTDEAADFGEVLLWTMREPDPAQVLAEPALLDGKIVIDLNNRDYADEARRGAWFDRAIAERLQENVSGARVVKAFNLMAMETFDTDPAALRAAGAQTFLAGDDAEAKRVVGTLATDLGFEPVDVGRGAAALRAVEALGDVIRLMMIDGGHGGRVHLRLTSLPVPTLSSVGMREASAYH